LEKQYKLLANLILLAIVVISVQQRCSGAALGCYRTCSSGQNSVCRSRYSTASRNDLVIGILSYIKFTNLNLWILLLEIVAPLIKSAFSAINVESRYLAKLTYPITETYNKVFLYNFCFGELQCSFSLEKHFELLFLVFILITLSFLLLKKKLYMK
jgi:hypothetical protein